ncbi:hypothetical protein Tdes44962_MAKER10455, partial [Teratosphaeria destructans]
FAAVGQAHAGEDAGLDERALHEGVVDVVGSVGLLAGAESEVVAAAGHAEEVSGQVAVHVAEEGDAVVPVDVEGEGEDGLVAEFREQGLVGEGEVCGVCWSQEVGDAFPDVIG